MTVMSVSIIVPAYNEEGRLPATLAATATFFAQRQTPFDLIVVDDGSQDGTADVVADFSCSHPEWAVQCLRYGVNRGKGYAVRYGMLRAHGDLRLFCDADLATPPEEFEVVHAGMTQMNAEVGIGSRPQLIRQSGQRQPWYREWLGRGFNTAVQCLAVPGILDTQCGFKIFTARAAQEVFSRCRVDGFAFDAEALYVARRLGYTIAEVPVRWMHQDGSKVSMKRDGPRMLRELAGIRRIHRNLKALSTTNPVRPPHS
jgi:dolichyl-phosphate beta-glucosyltransferase